MSAHASKHITKIDQTTARNLWIKAQRLDHAAQFGEGAEAVHRAISHLGYVQIDVINVIERCHHHILFNRIPKYKKDDLELAQSEQKSVFEYWTHALSYLPVEAFAHYVSNMQAHSNEPQGWGGQTNPAQLQKVIKRITEEGPLAVSDFKDDKLKAKTHLWASKKPSKSALEAGFYAGKLLVSKRRGVEKLYELTQRHFGWDTLPNPKTPLQTLNYELDRALTAQGFVSLNSVCHLVPSRKPAIAKLIAARVKSKKLIQICVGKDDITQYFIKPELLDISRIDSPSLTHILSPFDPLIIQRKRTAAIFAHTHIFEAYVPAKKRKWGYFTLPVLVGNRIVAGLDLKTDRQKGELLIQVWHWFDEADRTQDKIKIETALHAFEAFQFSRPA